MTGGPAGPGDARRRGGANAGEVIALGEEQDAAEPNPARRLQLGRDKGTRRDIQAVISPPSLE